MTADPTQSSVRDEQAMTRAIELAREAQAMGEVPVGAVVYRTETGETLGEGFNRRETDDDPTAHAEILAIREAAAKIGDWRFNECTLVVTLEPCVMCAGAIVNARVGRLVYGASDPKAGAVESLYQIPSDNRLNHRPSIIPGVMAEACGELLRAFFRERRGK
jgi:tRNA(adenine34) deaminase